MRLLINEIVGRSFTKRDAALRRKPRGLHRLSPDLISKAIEETNTQIIRIGMTFLGTAAFCLLSLFNPEDSALLGGSEKITVPLAGPVSFFGFMLLGPAVLIILRVYMQVYIEHGSRLEGLGRSAVAVRAPTLIPFRNPLIWVIAVFAYYFVLPLTLVQFAWRAAAFPAWGSSLLCVAVWACVGQSALAFSRISWLAKTLLSVAAVIFAASILFHFGPLHRSLILNHANLSNQWLDEDDFRWAQLSYANVSNTNLVSSDLTHADLTNANLSKTKLSSAKLNFADLSSADLTNATLYGAKLREAKLVQAKLSNADLIDTDLSGANLDGANLNGAQLFQSNLTGAKLRRAQLDGASLLDATLLKADLTGAGLRGAELANANLSGADLQAAWLNGAKLGHANLSGADLSYAKLNAASLNDTNLDSSDLSYTNLSGALLYGTNLHGANLSGANLSGANLSTATVTQNQIDETCGDEKTMLPEPLTLKNLCAGVVIDMQAYLHHKKAIFSKPPPGVQAGLPD